VSRFPLAVLALVALAALAVPGTALSQEAEQDPPVLRLSFFMCDLSGGNGDAIDAEIETQDMPIWNALVDEGMVESYGYFFHWWADEWNLGIYTIAPTIQAILDASAEATERLEAQYGEDAPSAIASACPHHRDGFYTMGPNTDMGDEAAAAGGS
jgi:hypothetical protein